MELTEICIHHFFLAEKSLTLCCSNRNRSPPAWTCITLQPAGKTLGPLVGKSCAFTFLVLLLQSGRNTSTWYTVCTFALGMSAFSACREALFSRVPAAAGATESVLWQTPVQSYNVQEQAIIEKRIWVSACRYCSQDVKQHDRREIGFIKSEWKCKFMSIFSRVFVLLSNKFWPNVYKQTVTSDRSINNIPEYTDTLQNNWLQSWRLLMWIYSCIHPVSPPAVLVPCIRFYGNVEAVQSMSCSSMLSIRDQQRGGWRHADQTTLTFCVSMTQKSSTQPWRHRVEFPLRPNKLSFSQFFIFYVPEMNHFIVLKQYEYVNK